MIEGEYEGCIDGLLPEVAVMAFSVMAICRTSFSVNKFFFRVDLATWEIIVIMPRGDRKQKGEGG